MSDPADRIRYEVRKMEDELDQFEARGGRDRTQERRIRTLKEAVSDLEDDRAKQEKAFQDLSRKYAVVKEKLDKLAILAGRLFPPSLLNWIPNTKNELERWGDAVRGSIHRTGKAPSYKTPRITEIRSGDARPHGLFEDLSPWQSTGKRIGKLVKVPFSGKNPSS